MSSKTTVSDAIKSPAIYPIRPTKVSTDSQPQQASQLPRCDQSMIYYRSPFMAPSEDGEWSSYEPVEGGGFFIRGGKQICTRPIVQGMNHLITGDRPLFAMKTGTGGATAGFDSEYSAFPLFGRDSTGSWKQVWPTLGYIAIAALNDSGDKLWLHERENIATTFMPGYTQYELEGDSDLGDLSLTVAPAMDGHGLILQVDSNRPLKFYVKVYGMTWATDRSWNGPEFDDNKVERFDRTMPEGESPIARLTEVNMGLTELWSGLSVPSELTIVRDQPGHKSESIIELHRGDEAAFTTRDAVQSFHAVVLWGVGGYDEALAEQMMGQLDTANTAPWPEERDKLKASWFDTIIGRALNPRDKFEAILAKPSEELARTVAWWDERRNQFQINTPDPYLNSLMSWVYSTTQYNQLGPGLTNSGSESDSYGHLSPGWWGKLWCGDHESHKTCLRLYGALQLDDEYYHISDRDACNRHYPYFETVEGAIPWMTQALEPAIRENHNPFWVDQVWWAYCWTGDEQFVRDLFPAVKRASDFQIKVCDPDGDGLFQEHYGFWTGDNGGEGPKAVTVTVTSWAMLDRTAKMARIVGDTEAEKYYQDYADKSYAAIQREMWSEECGVLGSIGKEGTWREHMQIWNECLAVESGSVSKDQGRRAMRWCESHYGFHPNPGIDLMMSSDWFPLRWSLQFVHTGDTCRAALAGLMCGDADLWWPYIRTIVRASFNGRYPGVNYGVNNKGASEGIEEQLDSTDAHIHMAVRGLFGITPAIHEGKLHICPAFPSDWEEASIKTPEFSFTYQRKGDEVEYHITSAKPLVKHVRGNLTGQEVVTPAETESTVTVKLGTPVPYEKPDHKPTIRIKGIHSKKQMEWINFEIVNEDENLQLEEQGLVPPPALTRDEKQRQVMIDLREEYNLGYDEMMHLPVLFDYDEKPIELRNFWGIPHLKSSEGKSCGAMRQAVGLWKETHPHTKDVSTGVRFLIADMQPTYYPEIKRLLAVSSTEPYPLPCAATIEIGMKCDAVWPLLQCYAHAMKNYIPNGEIWLHYETGDPTIEQLIPPYNMDTYFQHYSLKGVPVMLGHQRDADPWGYGFDNRDLFFMHADAIKIDADPQRALKSVEIKAVCTESIIAIAGLTVIEAK